jgi:hypothetical protein
LTSTLKNCSNLVWPFQFRVKTKENVIALVSAFPFPVYRSNKLVAIHDHFWLRNQKAKQMKNS